MGDAEEGMDDSEVDNDEEDEADADCNKAEMVGEGVPHNKDEEDAEGFMGEFEIAGDEGEFDRADEEKRNL